jgi:uncharacterized protein involved in exopolysaccharide biosynthesis
MDQYFNTPLTRSKNRASAGFERRVFWIALAFAAFVLIAT